ncbi:LPXTG cell wall anchor domain-containing protein [Streptococcus suis]|nr:LPXTG cell wall anchor domain-containing protein [Streptococcus suis]NQN67643.1 LPXTG cell wall anchor domain-containing protein [Streptococcus suis]
MFVINRYCILSGAAMLVASLALVGKRRRNNED